MKIDHIAIAVNDVEESAKVYQQALGVDSVEFETIETEGVKVAIIHLENARIELMQPTNDTSPIKKFLEKKGQGLHHLALETDNAERIIVGVNKYSEEEKQPDLLRVGGEVEIQQRKALKKLRASRDKKKWEKALSAMQSAAETEENLMPYIVTAAKAFATTGEISNTFREVFGEYRPKEVF